MSPRFVLQFAKFTPSRTDLAKAASVTDAGATALGVMQTVVTSDANPLSSKQRAALEHEVKRLRRTVRSWRQRLKRWRADDAAEAARRLDVLLQVAQAEQGGGDDHGADARDAARTGHHVARSTGSDADGSSASASAAASGGGASDGASSNTSGHASGASSVRCGASLLRLFVPSLSMQPGRRTCTCSLRLVVCARLPQTAHTSRPDDGWVVPNAKRRARHRRRRERRQEREQAALALSGDSQQPEHAPVPGDGVCGGVPPSSVLGQTAAPVPAASTSSGSPPVSEGGAVSGAMSPAVGSTAALPDGVDGSGAAAADRCSQQ